MATKRTFKVSKKKLTGTKALYRPWRDWETGDIVIVEYQSQTTDNYDKPNWVCKVLDAQFVNKKDNKKFQDQVIGLNSNGKLDRAMKKVAEGDVIQIEYLGMGEMQGGKNKGKDAHDLEVRPVEEDDGSGYEDTYEEDGPDRDDDDESDEDEEDEEDL